MSGFFRGYDAWKTREPEPDYELCEMCGRGMCRDKRGWYCEHCTPDPEWEREE